MRDLNAALRASALRVLRAASAHLERPRSVEARDEFGHAMLRMALILSAMDAADDIAANGPLEYGPNVVFLPGLRH